MKKLLLLSKSIILFISRNKSTQKDFKDASLSIDEHVETLLPLLFIEEKGAQMRIFHAQIGVETDGNGNSILSNNII